MTKKSKNCYEQKRRVKQAVELLKFVLPLDDDEIIKSTIESVIEILQEEIDE